MSAVTMMEKWSVNKTLLHSIILSLVSLPSMQLNRNCRL